MSSNFPPADADLREDQASRAFQTFVRGSRRVMETGVWDRAYRDFRETVGDDEPTPEDALTALDRLPAFQVHAWMFRNIQRFKYTYPDWGIVSAAEAERPRLEAALDGARARGEAEGSLRLDPDIDYPEYYRHVDFHQHPGGVWSDPLDGLIYDVARRTTIPAHMDPDTIYRQLFASLPQGRRFERVLDWGTGHGAGLHTWLEAHPDSEGHGIDLSAPCLTFAWKKAEERGLTPVLSQQDVAGLDYPDDHFDLIFFVFMLHEIPPGPTPAILREVHRVLRPGGLFFGAEFRPPPRSGVFSQTMLVHSQWCNNEVYTPAYLRFPYVETAREIGFSRAEVRPFDRLARPQPAAPQGQEPVPAYAEFVLFDFEK
jgi:ubiquinone/menaquinone biosynthesis C-methylase UbiE